MSIDGKLISSVRNRDVARFVLYKGPEGKYSFSKQFTESRLICVLTASWNSPKRRKYS